MDSDDSRSALESRAGAIRRRTVMKGAAWATPLIAASVAAPAYAASGNVVLSYSGCAIEEGTVFTYARLTFNVTVANLAIPVGTHFYMAALEDGVTTFSSHGSMTHYGGTLKPYLGYGGGDMWCLSPPCEEMLSVQTLIPPGIYTLSVDVAIDTNPTTLRFKMPVMSTEMVATDNEVLHKVFKTGNTTSCATS